MLEVTAIVQPALFEPSAEITRIVADLSNMGGASQVPLMDLGDGTYQLETSFRVDSPHGWRNLSVLVDQATSLGPYWMRLSKGIFVFSTKDLHLLDEELAAGWQVEGRDGVEAIHLDQGTIVYQGSAAAAFQVRPESRTVGWTVKFRTETPVEPLGYEALRFAFHPGGAQGEPVDRLTVGINDRSRIFITRGEYAVDIQRLEWQALEIPLEALNVEGPIQSIRFNGNLIGTFYLDDVRLVAVPPPLSATAVLEERVGAVPQAFALAQNFPNPFNSSTIIRFALPQSAEVELSIFNLAGQQVATLVAGWRGAGEYTLNWDGRDESGRELASGIYLYRLQAGERGETRKLVLVR